MFIPYEKIGAFVNKFISKNDCVKDLFYKLKVSQNVRYVKRNKPIVIKKLRKKLEKGESLKVVFYVYDETKWKCQSLYDLLLEDSRFEVLVLVTKNAAKNIDNPSYQTKNDIARVYNFFKERNINVELAYDFEKSKFIPFEKYKPDIIFYQHPWYVETSQGPVVCSKFSLTGYIPYYFPIEAAEIDVNLRFHKYVETYYVLNEYTKNIYEAKLNKKIENISVVGYPYLDAYSNYKESNPEYVIYAPHWTVGNKGLAYSTFDWSGKYLLEYAILHPEIKWVFKPHPMLYKALIDNKIMTKDEVKSYYDKWAEVGLKYESGEYLDLFAKSKMMITDCSSFLGEYLITDKPLIHLISENSQFKDSKNPILKSYYRANNLDELKKLLEILPDNDYMKDIRSTNLLEMNLNNVNASKNIVSELLKLVLIDDCILIK